MMVWFHMNNKLIGVLLLVAFIAGYIMANPALMATPAEAVTASIDGKALERISPQDHVKEEQITVLSDKVILNVKDASWTTFTDTNSMDPLLDIGSNGIEIKPETINDVKVGDVISYNSQYGLIIHRIVKTGFDEKGWYALAKGDNNPVQDPEKVRFGQIHGVLVAVVY